MAKLNNSKREEAKRTFSSAMQSFVCRLTEHVSAEDGGWTVKGFIDIYKNIYTISSDTKIISKILEIHLFPQILQFAEENKYSIVLAESQNWYPDLSFVSQEDFSIKFALDIKTTYRDPDFSGHVNGFTLGSHGTYFKDRTSTKNIQFPYGEYLGHFCLGIIYTRADGKDLDETEIINVKELDDEANVPQRIGQRKITKVESLRSITSVIKDFQFFVCEKWRLASDHQGSHNTANIGSITFIEDILKGNGVFAKLGEDWFDEYWMNYGLTTMKKKGKTVTIKRIEDFIDFKGGKKLKNLIVPVVTKRKS
ncbi:MAG TPA: type II restriction endonuclease [Candidatus Wunengus sp. YC60]|uniref:type II restriction endonuclease n=1 Tax=Candidatus Wunengus sp. YC60 TaxID=3367697 RepID=UPI0040262D00